MDLLLGSSQGSGHQGPLPEPEVDAEAAAAAAAPGPVASALAELSAERLRRQGRT